MRKRLSKTYREAMADIIREHEAKYHRSLSRRFWRKFVARAFGKKP